MRRIIFLFILLALVAPISALAAEIPWADAIIHTNPVLERGLGPEAVSPGYQIVPLSDTGTNGEPVESYTSWMTGRDGEKVWVKFRPGEAVEAKCAGSKNVDRYLIETWIAKRVVRCGNPTSITFYVRKALPKVKVVVKQVPVVYKQAEQPAFELNLVTANGVRVNSTAVTPSGAGPLILYQEPANVDVSLSNNGNMSQVQGQVQGQNQGQDTDTYISNLINNDPTINNTNQITDTTNTSVMVGP